MDVSPAKEVSHFILDKLQPRAISFEEQVKPLALILVDGGRGPK